MPVNSSEVVVRFEPFSRQSSFSHIQPMLLLF